MKRTKIILSLLFVLYLTPTAFAQNEQMYSQYIFNTLPINPAYAGSQENLSITALCRKQWLDMDGAPSTQTLSAHSPIKNKNIALGFSILHDKIGVTGKTGLYGVYSYRLKFKNNSKLSLGLQGGLIHAVSRFSQLQTKQQNDPHLNTDKTLFITPAIGAGAFWYSNSYYLGASIPDLLEVRINESGEAIQYRHFFIHGAYIFNLSDQLKYMPGFLVKEVDGSNPQFDINNLIILNDVLWLGVSYRISASINFLVQTQLSNQLQFGYSYDSPLGDFCSLAGASHELKLSYRFVFLKDDTYMPRYF